MSSMANGQPECQLVENIGICGGFVILNERWICGKMRIFCKFFAIRDQISSEERVGGVYAA